MKDIRKVLVALAFAEHAEDTFRFAAQFADMTGAQLIVANVINERSVESVRTISAMGYDVDGEHYVQNIKDERKVILNGILAAAGYPREKVTAFFVVGNPVNALLQIIVHEQIDVVIMGIKGATNLENIMVGSVAENLFRKSPVTVISHRTEKSAARLRSRYRM